MKSCTIGCGRNYEQNMGVVQKKINNLIAEIKKMIYVSENDVIRGTVEHCHQNVKISINDIMVDLEVVDTFLKECKKGRKNLGLLSDNMTGYFIKREKDNFVLLKEWEGKLTEILRMDIKSIDGTIKLLERLKMFKMSNDYGLLLKERSCLYDKTELHRMVDI